MSEKVLIAYVLQKSLRSTISVRVLKTGKIKVLAPFFATKKQIECFLLKNQVWIENQKEKIAARQKEKDCFSLENQKSFFLFGKEIQIVESAEKKAAFNSFELHIPFSANHEQRKKIIKGILKKEIIPVLEFFIHKNEKLMKVQHSSTRISSATRTWGSCTSKKNLSFSCFLAMANVSVIEYVVIHELAHLIEMNHSPKFWKVVENFCPNFKNEKKALKELSQKINSENW